MPADRAKDRLEADPYRSATLPGFVTRSTLSEKANNCSASSKDSNSRERVAKRHIVSMYLGGHDRGSRCPGLYKVR